MVRSATTPLTVRLAKACAYAAVWYLGVYVKLGVPTFFALVIFAMFTCGTGERWAGDSSAYSVFNGGGERIAGTMTAEQIDAPMRNGGHAPRQENSYESNFVKTALRGWGGGSDHQPLHAAKHAMDEQQLRQRREVAAAAAQARVHENAGSVSMAS